MAKLNARRLRISSEFTCSRCGGHEAYRSHDGNRVGRYVLSHLMVQSVRCCDCDGLCYVFPLALPAPARGGTQRTPLSAHAA